MSDQGPLYSGESDTIEIAGRKFPKWLIYVAAGILVIGAVYILSRKQAGAAPGDGLLAEEYNQRLKEFYEAQVRPSDTSPGIPGAAETPPPSQPVEIPTPEPINYYFGAPPGTPEWGSGVYGYAPAFQQVQPATVPTVQLTSGAGIPLRSVEESTARLAATSKTMARPIEGFNRKTQIVLTNIQQTLSQKTAAVAPVVAKTAPVQAPASSQVTVAKPAKKVARPATVIPRKPTPTPPAVAGPRGAVRMPATTTKTVKPKSTTTTSRRR